MPEGFTVFLDRDGVFNVHPRVAVRSWDQFHWLPGVPEAFARLHRDDIRTCLCTNQPTVGLGLNAPWQIRRVNQRMADELAAAGGRLHHIEAAYAPPYMRHRRRKPRPGMLEDGARALATQGWEVDKQRAVMVGDNLKDAAAGNAFGVPAILLATTHSHEHLAQGVDAAGLDAIIVEGLPAAVDEILRRVGPED